MSSTPHTHDESCPKPCVREWDLDERTATGVFQRIEIAAEVRAEMKAAEREGRKPTRLPRKTKHPLWKSIFKLQVRATAVAFAYVGAYLLLWGIFAGAKACNVVLPKLPGVSP